MTTIPDLSGQTALVTGASRGIGRAVAIGLAKAGAHIIAVARTVGGLEDMDDEIKGFGGTASLIAADIRDKELISTLGPTLSTRFKSLDILIANAGIINELSPLHDIDEKTWTNVIDTNLTANWRLLSTLTPLLKASPHARIAVMTSGVGGEVARSFWGPYAVSKAGLEMLAKTYALENQAFGTRLAIVNPGAMRTRMRASVMPGEDPQTLPDPSAIMPLIYRVVAPDYDGIGEKLDLE